MNPNKKDALTSQEYVAEVNKLLESLHPVVAKADPNLNIAVADAIQRVVREADDMINYAKRTGSVPSARQQAELTKRYCWFMELCTEGKSMDDHKMRDVIVTKGVDEASLSDAFMERAYLRAKIQQRNYGFGDVYVVKGSDGKPDVISHRRYKYGSAAAQAAP